MSAVTWVFPNLGSHARLHGFERSRQLRLGAVAGYPLPRPRDALPVRIEQRFGFACEPRARWSDSGAGSAPVLEWGDLGVFAPLGPLPEHYTESALHARGEGGQRLRQFVGDITQRLAHLYFRAWAQLRPECEAGRPDDRFAELLSALSGSPTARLPYLAWHQPTLEQLPRLARAHCGVSVRVERLAIARLVNAEPTRLGQARLGQGRLGQSVFLFGIGQVRLWVGFDTGAQYLAWRAPGHAQRRHFEQLVQDCLRPGSGYQLRLLPPADLPAPELGHARLGRARLSISRDQR